LLQRDDADSIVESRYRVPDAVQRANVAPQSRDHLSDGFDGPRISSAPRRKRGALRSIRGTKFVGWAKRSVPTFYLKMVGTPRFAHPTVLLTPARQML